MCIIKVPRPQSVLKIKRTISLALWCDSARGCGKTNVIKIFPQALIPSFRIFIVLEHADYIPGIIVLLKMQGGVPNVSVKQELAM